MEFAQLTISVSKMGRDSYRLDVDLDRGLDSNKGLNRAQDNPKVVSLLNELCTTFGYEPVSVVTKTDRKVVTYLYMLKKRMA
jgi:hypothetical protein